MGGQGFSVKMRGSTVEEMSIKDQKMTLKMVKRYLKL
jgi:hypothetical protein